MIRGRLLAVGGRRRPYVTGRLTIHSQAVTGEVNFLDVLSHFALFFEERTARVLLLTRQEAATLALP